MAKDYTSYPQGFKNLCADMDLGKTFASDEEKEKFVWGFIDLVVRW